MFIASSIYITVTTLSKLVQVSHISVFFLVNHANHTPTHENADQKNLYFYKVGPGTTS